MSIYLKIFLFLIAIITVVFSFYLDIIHTNLIKIMNIHTLTNI